MIYRHGRSVLGGVLFVSFGLLFELPARAISQPAAVTTQTQEANRDKDETKGLVIRLSEGKAGSRPAASQAESRRLSDAEADRLLERLKPLVSGSVDTPFALPPRTSKPPRTGRRLSSAFPPSAGDQGSRTLLARELRELRVLRYQPEGEVQSVSRVAVTFSEPMVPLTSQEEAAAFQPVRLTPQPKGRWRWLGTQTVVFDAEGRMPQATNYRVEVPAGTQSVLGHSLANAVSFSFSTPPPTVVAKWPESGPQRPDTLIFVEFDQAIDPAAILKMISVETGSGPVPVRLATATELDGVSGLRPILGRARRDHHGDRWIALKAVERFPANSTMTVTLAAGAGSAEGPKGTRESLAWYFHTYGSLQVVRSNCGALEDPCDWPYSSLSVEFTNPLDEVAVEATEIQVKPAIPDLRVAVHGQSLYLGGTVQPGTTYQVTLPASLADEYGQTLGVPQKLTFRSQSAGQWMGAPRGFAVADPTNRVPTIDIGTMNASRLRVQLYAVSLEDVPAYASYQRRFENARNSGSTGSMPGLPGRKVFDRIVPVVAPPDTTAVTRVDLTPALAGRHFGHVILAVEMPDRIPGGGPDVAVAWVQVTQLAVDVQVDDTRAVASTTELLGGRAIGGVQLELLPGSVRAVSDLSGLATLALPDKPDKKEHASYLVARRGADTAFATPFRWWRWDEDAEWTRKSRKDKLAWYLTTDRNLYRKGEDVRFKGWVRAIDPRVGGDVSSVKGRIDRLDYVVNDARGVEIAKGVASLSMLGGWDARFRISDTANLGQASITVTASEWPDEKERSNTHRFKIEEFRRPEFEVVAKASPGPHFVGEAADLTVTATYFAGSSLPDAPVSWTVSQELATFAPPNWDAFTFGAIRELGETAFEHRRTFFDRDADDEPSDARMEPQSLSGHTDDRGTHTLHAEFPSARPARPFVLSAEATVTDANRQAWTATSTLLIHPAKMYVGVRAPSWGAAGAAIRFELVAVDLDGKAVPGRPISLRSSRRPPPTRGRRVTDEPAAQTTSAISGEGPIALDVTVGEGGQYDVVASVVDDAGRVGETTVDLWVAAKTLAEPSLVACGPTVRLIPDRSEYRPRDTARILLEAPFYPADALISVRRSGIVSSERVRIVGPTTTLLVPITEESIPNLSVEVNLTGSVPRLTAKGAPDPRGRRPASARGSAVLRVPPSSRRLSVMAQPAVTSVGPGARMKIDLSVLDATGASVPNAEVAVAVVDEAILSLAGHEYEDPLEPSYPMRGPEVEDSRFRDDLFMRQGGRFDSECGVPGGIVGGLPAEPPGTAIRLRTDFNPLAFFAPAVMTDADGRAAVEFAMPDNLTRYRVVALAAAGDKQFGKGESSITARLPLMVRPSPPRFLNFGDTFELPVIVQNQTDELVTAQVVLRATNLTSTEGRGREVRIPANDRVEVRFAAKADGVGVARIQIATVAGLATDAAEVSLPVWSPATSEAFATYGVIDKGAIAQPVSVPPGVAPQFGGLEAGTSSTSLQSLTDAVLYLVKYPYECAEQVASRILAVTALRDVLTAFNTKEMPTPEDMEARVRADLKKLATLQNEDGGFGFWKRGDESLPYLTVHVANALVRAKGKGYDVDASMLRRAIEYLRDITDHFSPSYSQHARQTITAYALYVRRLDGVPDVAGARKLLTEAGGPASLSMEANGWLLGVLAGRSEGDIERAAIREHLTNAVTETAGAANFTTATTDEAQFILHSERRADGVILESLIQDDEGSDLIPKLVAGLLAHRKAGRWSNTQDNAFVLLGLERYFRTYEQVTPDFVARAWLGDSFVGEQSFKGRDAARREIEVPMAWMAANNRNGDLVIQKSGSGRLYYRLGLDYAPQSLSLAAVDNGFAVERQYEAVDDPGDVTRDVSGAWVIRAGARVRIRLTLVAESRRYHVALTDPLPAGLEAMNPELATTGSLPREARPAAESVRGRGSWYEHQNFRDERTEAFASLLPAGLYEYTYLARATTPGAFVVPPTKAEEMYMPETFGRSDTARVIVR